MTLGISILHTDSNTFDVGQETKIQHALPFLKAHCLLTRIGIFHVCAAPTPLFWVRFTVLGEIFLLGIWLRATYSTPHPSLSGNYPT